MLGAEGVRVSRMISTVVLFMVTLVVGILFYRVMVGFFVPLFLAALLVVIFRPVHEWISLRLGKRRRLAALTTTASILLVVLLPAVLVIGIAAAQGTSLLSRVNYNSLAFALERTREQLGLDIENVEPFERIPYLVQALSEIEGVADERELRAAKDRFKEFQQVLMALETDFQPLSEAEEDEFAETRGRLDLLYLKLLNMADQAKPAAPTIPQSPPPDPNEVVENSAADATNISRQGPLSNKAENAPADDLAREADDEAFDNVQPVKQAIDADNAETEDTDADEADPNADYRSPAEQYQRALVDVDSQARELTTSLLGGPIRAQLKIWANPSEEEISQLLTQAQEYLQPRLLRVTSATGEFLIQTLIGISILTIALYFFLVDGPEMVRTLMKLSPLDDRYELRLLLEFDQTSRAVVLATVISALAQGILAVFGYYFAGLGSIILLFLMTTFMALIPFLGAAAIWIPCALWLGLVEERWGAAIGLAIYGLSVVSTVDNLIKVFVLHGRSQLHPLLALLSVLGGVQVFGPIGILVGPMVVVFLQSTLEILNHELSAYEKDEQPNAQTHLALAGGPAVHTSQTTESGDAQVPLDQAEKVAKTDASHSTSSQPKNANSPQNSATNRTGRKRRK